MSLDLGRRTFLGAMLAASAAPAIVRASSLMKIYPVRAEALLEFRICAYGGGFTITDAYIQQFNSQLQAAFVQRLSRVPGTL